MRTEKCKTCRNYIEHPKEHRTGMEWMNATGWCELPRLSTKRRRIDEDNWCDQYSEKEMPPEPVEEIVEDAPTPPYANLYDAIATVRASLDELQRALDEAVNPK